MFYEFRWPWYFNTGTKSEINTEYIQGKLACWKKGEKLGKKEKAGAVGTSCPLELLLEFQSTLASMVEQKGEIDAGKAQW